jgi:hypothetical protein
MRVLGSLTRVRACVQENIKNATQELTERWFCVAQSIISIASPPLPSRRPTKATVLCAVCPSFLYAYNFYTLASCMRTHIATHKIFAQAVSCDNSSCGCTHAHMIGCVTRECKGHALSLAASQSTVSCPCDPEGWSTGQQVKRSTGVVTFQVRPRFYIDTFASSSERQVLSEVTQMIQPHGNMHWEVRLDARMCIWPCCMVAEYHNNHAPDVCWIYVCLESVQQFRAAFPPLCLLTARSLS